MKTTKSKPARKAVRSGGLVTDIRVCRLPYQPGPFVCGTIKDPTSETGLRNVWLRNDRKWTRHEEDVRNTLKMGGWDPPNMEVCDGGRKASESKQDANRHSQH